MPGGWVLAAAPVKLCVLGCLLLALPAGQAFLPNFWSRILTLSWDSHTHQYMTEQALLNITLDTLSALRPQDLQATPQQTVLGRGFWHAVGEVVRANANVDFWSTTRSDPEYHFDSERVEGATAKLREFWNQTLSSIRNKEYQGARKSLGQLLHSLQDFYSHSNWVEMGQQSVYLHLLHPGEPSVPVASVDIPTCAECYTTTCRDNVLPKLTQGQHPPLLTTGYFSTQPVKPPGKCSHGGLLDSSRHREAKGGINKDSTSPLFSPHHYLHAEAARLATAATVAMLLDLRNAVGPSSFLRLLSVRERPALVFVMDTTGSMFEEITAARLRALSIIQARAHDPEQPGTYLLVPFHDPDVGPVYETEDPEMFMHYLENLTALGGGDEPEMCLSAVLLALTHSPPLSEIFVFTDASPKDAHLNSTVEALALEKQSKVTFLLTEDSSSVGRGRGARKRREALSAERFFLYTRLSSVSGGLTIFTTNSDIQRVSAIVQDNTAGNKVTLLHAESDSSSVLNHSFHVDQAVKTVTLHLAGTLKHCILTNPTGHIQSLLGDPGPLAELERFQGLFRIALLDPIQRGQWHLSVRSEGHIALNAIGDSSVDFLYYFAVEDNGTHPGLAKVEGTPVAGVPTFVVLSVTGLSPRDEASFTHVTLLGVNGESLLEVPLNSSSSSASGEELVGRMESVPREPFSVRLCGRDGLGGPLERVSTEIVQPTHVRIEVLSAPHLVPGHRAVVRFHVLNHGPARHFKLNTENDRGFLSQSGPQRLFVDERGSVTGEVEINTPSTAEPGGAVTLILTVRAQDSPDGNYAVVHLTIIPPDPDWHPPSCSPMRVEASCPPVCSHGSWAVSFTISDKGQSGLAALQLLHGEGTLSLIHGHRAREGRKRRTDGKRGQEYDANRHGSDGHRHDRHRHERHEVPLLRQGESPLNISAWASVAPLRVRYKSSCCFPQAVLLIWDGAGNLMRCRLSSSQEGSSKESSSSAERREIMPFVMLMGVLVPVVMFALI
ncbi:von Willebrand factor A domain-containing protein 7 [Scleropages formosus]|uniref:von Willebrand factor A domain-containing protein 7 n=1 Tax=Scleropages formosus TaxID=113540 RepID=UPI0010FA9C18|nr:von Willebrand factor A domain-containing protein 7-like [Scleropages formosus]